MTWADLIAAVPIFPEKRNIEWLYHLDEGTTVIATRFGLEVYMFWAGPLVSAVIRCDKDSHMQYGWAVKDAPYANHLFEIEMMESML